jgi:predicted DCC family thiol-disulfide oxidoreductase YuxK
MKHEVDRSAGARSSPGPTRVASLPEDRPVILYDADCGFCTRWIGRCRKLFGESIEYVPSAEGASRFPEISREALEGAVHLVDTDGRVYAGADAVARALARRPGHGWVLWCYAYIPGLAWAARKTYGWVARRRRRL